LATSDFVYSFLKETSRKENTIIEFLRSGKNILFLILSRSSDLIEADD
jgi:hypothetical protein